MAETRLSGLCASPGLALGPVSFVAPFTPGATLRATASPQQERAELLRAIVEARAQIQALIQGTRGDTAEILGFQEAMLEDDELTGPALAAIATGASAIEAWQSSMAAEANTYEGDDDRFFAARAVDLLDIRDRVLERLVPGAARPGSAAGAVIVGTDLPLSRFLEIDWSLGGAIILTRGSPTGHVAMLARARGVPMVVGTGGIAETFAGLQALVDGSAALVVFDPSEDTRASFKFCSAAALVAAGGYAIYAAGPAVTADGTPISIMLNLNSLAELEGLNPATCDGIGLVRTELLFHHESGLPSEDKQYSAYRRIAEWAEGRPVVIRTLDEGGDKPISDKTPEGQSNSFLGVRGLRLSLRNRATFRDQLRALARAAAHGNIRVMLPMVAIPAELEASRVLLGEVMQDLAREGSVAREPDLGIMVEVPAAAIAVDLFDRADFFSIGSNDLTQYVMAAGRDIGAVAGLADPLNPAVLRLVETVARHGRQTGRDVSLCGDAAAEQRCIDPLLRAGVRTLSVTPAALGRVKSAVATIDLERPSTVSST